MDREEFLETAQLIANLISIRDYTINAVNNFNLNKETSRTMQKMLTLLDKQISEAILDDNFKNCLDFDRQADAVMAEVVRNNNPPKPVSGDNQFGIAVSGNGQTIKL